MLRRLAGGASVILCRQTIGPGRSGSAPLRRTPIWPLYIRQYRTIPALRLKHRSGSCGTASALPKCSIMSGCGTRIVLRGQKPLALCDRCPCFGSLFPPLAALTFVASSIICAFGLASAAPRSPYRHLELCGIALMGIAQIDKDTPQRISCCGVFFMAVWQGWEPNPARHFSFFSRAFSFLADFCAGLKKCFHFIEYCDIMQRTNKMPHKRRQNHEVFY